MQESDVILKRMMSLHPKKIDLTLGRIENLLEKLGRPQDRLPRTVHVAGTNGKGSTLAFLKAMCVAEGLSVHRYTSPHLVRFSERIQLNGTDIDESLLSDLLERVEQINDGAPITFFEVTTAAAFLAFAEHPADILLLETGLGGRLDATNVIDKPALTIITPISLDHQDWLGETLLDIAREKAGIIKPGVPLISASQPEDVSQLFVKLCGNNAAPCLMSGRDWSLQGRQVIVNTTPAHPSWALHLPEPSLHGSWQQNNAALAAVAAHQLGLTDQAIVGGVTKAVWNGRMQRLNPKENTLDLPHAWRIWYDGGHNTAAAEAIARDWQCRDPSTSCLIIGMIDTKDVSKFLKTLAPHFHAIYAVPVPDSNASVPTNVFARLARDADRLVLEMTTILSALEHIKHAEPDTTDILITGSLYLGGEIDTLFV